MEAARAIKMIDPRTGDIILRGAGASRLSQAMAAGLVADTLKSDVEAVSRENSGLKAALSAARMDARMEARRASELRRKKSWTATCARTLCARAGQRCARSRGGSRRWGLRPDGTPWPRREEKNNGTI